MKYGSFLVMSLLLFPFSLFAEPVPDGYTCVPDEALTLCQDLVFERLCMEEALDGENEEFLVEFEDYVIVVTKDGQVFDQEFMEMRLTWCDYQIVLSVKPNLVIHMKKDVPDPEPEWGFRLRIRVGATLMVTDFSESPLRTIEPSLLVEPFFFKHYHVAAYFGPRSFGPVLGVDLLKNLNLYGGVGATWSGLEIGPVVGLSLSFN
jgi:hypothetical protein